MSGSSSGPHRLKFAISDGSQGCVLSQDLIDPFRGIVREGRGDMDHREPKEVGATMRVK